MQVHIHLTLFPEGTTDPRAELPDSSKSCAQTGEINVSQKSPVFTQPLLPENACEHKRSS